MRKKRTDDTLHLSFYARHSVDALKLLFTHPKLFIPDLLLLLITLALTTLFLAINNLLAPLLSAARLTLIRDQFTTILTNAPALSRLILSFLALLFVNVAFGISLIALRYEYMKHVTIGKNTSLWTAYKHSRSTLISLITIKLVLAVLYFGILTLLTYFFAQTHWTLFITVPLILLLVLVRISFFYAIQNLYLAKTGVTALAHSFRFFKEHPKQTLLAVLFVAAIDFLVSILLGLFPSSWGRIALHLNLLDVTTIAITTFLAIRILLSVLVNLWAETFKFLAYNNSS